MIEVERAPRDRFTISTLVSRSAGLNELEAKAADAFGWLAVERHANSLLRNLATGIESKGLQGARPEMDQAQADMQATLDRAKAKLAAYDQGAIDEARRRLGIRLALIGKGGAGKTVISSSLARLLGRQGRNVLAMDLDVNPGLAISLGLPPTNAGLPPEAVVPTEGAAYGWALAPGLTPMDVVERYAIKGPDNVHYLGMGKIGTTDKTHTRQSVVALLHVLLGFTDPEWHVIADMEAGPTTPFERYHAFAEEVLVVVGPAWRSGMTARRLLPMVGERTTTIVANRFRDEPDHPGLEPSIRIPFDPDLAKAERHGRPPIEACPDSPAIAKIAQLAGRLAQQEVRL